MRYYLNEDVSLNREVIVLITPQQINIIKSNILVSQDIPLKDSVYEALRKTIIIGEIPAGERINEKELAEKLNISRTPCAMPY